MRRVRVESRKWPGDRHWHYEVVDLGHDRHGRWLALPPGGLVQRGDEPPKVNEGGFVMLVPEGAWWSVKWNAIPRRFAVYCDVQTPATWEEGRVSMVDLDLDVVRFSDGTVAVLDEDEFEEHRAAFGYPEHVVDRARATAARLHLALEAGRPPFGADAAAWLARFREVFGA